MHKNRGVFRALVIASVVAPLIVIAQAPPPPGDTPSAPPGGTIQQPDAGNAGQSSQSSSSGSSSGSSSQSASSTSNGTTPPEVPSAPTQAPPPAPASTPASSTTGSNLPPPPKPGTPSGTPGAGNAQPVIQPTVPGTMRGEGSQLGVPLGEKKADNTPLVSQVVDIATSTQSKLPFIIYVLIGIAVAAVTIVPFGFFVAGYLRRKKEPDDNSENRCFDIKALMEEKFKELTNLKALALERALERGKEAVRDAVSGTATGDMLVKIERLEEQYLKLKKLYEECQIDIDTYRYKGVLIENSLTDKEILKRVKVIRSRDEGEWKLHDIRLSKKQIADIQKNIVDTGWFFHLWEPGKDEITVVFMDAIFSIRHSDRSTWKPAIEHGVQNGIPQKQLDFPIVV